MMMYQVPIDMMMRITSVAFATTSLPRQSASRPYGLSTTSVDLVAFAGAGAGAVAAGAAGVAGVVAAGASLPCACASGTSNATAANTIAASAAQRVIFNMVS